MRAVHSADHGERPEQRAPPGGGQRVQRLRNNPGSNTKDGEL